MKIVIGEKRKKDIFIAIFGLLKNSTSLINAFFKKDELYIQGMDKSHVCLFDLHLKSNWFTEYSVDTCDSICLDTSMFLSIISSKSDNQLLVIKKETDDELLIELVSDPSMDCKKTDYNKFYNLQLSENEYEEMGIPTTEYDAEIELPSKRITELMSQASDFGDDIIITCTEECIDFTAKNTSGGIRINVPVDDVVSYSIMENETIKLTYSLVYINKLCITNKVSDNIEFSLSNNQPMKIKYDLGDTSNLCFFIAPKMNED
jgi:proliferating cell nuclear antigen